MLKQTSQRFCLPVTVCNLLDFGKYFARSAFHCQKLWRHDQTDRQTVSRRGYSRYSWEKCLWCNVFISSTMSFLLLVPRRSPLFEEKLLSWTVFPFGLKPWTFFFLCFPCLSNQNSSVSLLFYQLLVLFPFGCSWQLPANSWFYQYTFSTWFSPWLHSVS